MVGVQHVDFEIVPRSVPWIEACSLWDLHHLAAGTDYQARAEGLIAPTQADHVVVGGPVEKRIVRGVIDYQAAARADVFFEGLLYTGRPANAGVRVSPI